MVFVLTMNNTQCKIDNGGVGMNKSVTISIRINEDELEKIKLAARLSSYSSYSEFIRRTVLIEASKIISQSSQDEQMNGKQV